MGLLGDLHIVMRTRRHQSSSDPMPHRHRAVVESHVSVLLHESLEILDIQPDDVVLDATLGGAGHAKEMVAKLGPMGIFIGIDADADAIKRAEAALKGTTAKIILIEGNFRNVKSCLGKHGIQQLDKALFDLGWSSYQMTAGRGFSFAADEPLLMTYSGVINENTLTAGKIVNTWEESNIADILYGWGEERHSRKIARAIVARRVKPITTSRELASIIARTMPQGRIHPATKTFQALRIAVNDEMGALKEGLNATWNLLNSSGRLACISFHSVEDRAVKNIMHEWETRGEGRRLSKKPIAPSREEILHNPRSRSAKLRCMKKY